MLENGLETYTSPIICVVYNIFCPLLTFLKARQTFVAASLTFVLEVRLYAINVVRCQKKFRSVS